MDLSDRLQELRKTHHFSQEQLAEKLNVSRQAVSKWESSQLSENMDLKELKSEIEKAMTALKNLDMETFNQYTNNRQSMVTPWGKETIEYTLFGELCSKEIRIMKPLITWIRR